VTSHVEVLVRSDGRNVLLVMQLVCAWFHIKLWVVQNI